MERIRDGRTLRFTYHGGSTPGEPRSILPVFLFTVPSHSEIQDLSQEPVYLMAHCLTRGSVRIFRLDRIQIA